ncbi:MAG: trans-aconitate methyltransferase [Citrobacter freundii]|nr:MAG: trans-aconitate methyltransferase [Citrobacter freundii]
MPWDPDKYNQFKNIRYKPFFDLADLITPGGLENCVDIGCGTGEQTKILSERFPDASFLGIDPSPEMLAKSREFESSNLRFEQATVEDFISSRKAQRWDLIFSNAALQWSNDHEKLFPQLIGLLSDEGQLAIQMPVQKENVLNRLLTDLAGERPFVDYLKGWKRESPLLSIDQYAQIMFEHGLSDIQLIQKVYPIIADSEEKLFDFISGSALIPYLERMKEEEEEEFIEAYKSRIRDAFRNFPAIYAFKRLLLYGKK